MEYENKKLYSDLRCLFYEKGLKIGDIAEKTGMAQPTLSNMLIRLKEGKSIKTENLFKILKATGCKIKLFTI